jgi:hypothetical protein
VLGEEAEKKPKTSIKHETYKETTNFKLTIKPAFLPNPCYALVAVYLAEKFNRSKFFLFFLCVGKNILINSL